jgi:hypothetical protein
MQLDITKEEREIIIDTLKAYYGLHGDDMPDTEQKELVRVIEKIEKVH